MTSKHAGLKRVHDLAIQTGKEASDWRKKIAAEALTQGSYQQGINWINKLKPKIDDSFPGGTLGAEINFLREIAEDARQDVMKQALSQKPKE